MSDNIRILFVDDEPKILDGLRRMLRSMRKEWDMSFANGGPAALEVLAGNPHDVIVSDIRMPQMTGVELLEEVRKRYPHMIRIALSGQASRETVLRSVGPTHQYLPKPCDADTLKATIGRLGLLRDLLSVPQLRGVISSMESLPSLPNLYATLTSQLDLPEPSIKAVAQTVSQDLGMSSKLLQLVSTGFFGPPRRVANPTEAASMLGLDILRPLVLTWGVFSQFDQNKIDHFSLDAVYLHGVEVAMASKRIAEMENADETTQQSVFLAGLLHDVGKVVFADQLSEEYQQILRENIATHDFLEVERQVIGATHAQVGAYLLGIWGLPDAIINAVAYHHSPMDSSAQDGFNTLTAVHVANAIISTESPRLPVVMPESVDEVYLAKSGWSGRLADWREVCSVCVEEMHHA